MRPYSDIPNLVVEFTILVQAARNNRRPKIPEKCPPSFSKLITDSWAKDPNSRPDSNQLLERLQTIHIKEYDETKAKWDALCASSTSSTSSTKKSEKKREKKTDNKKEEDEDEDDDEEDEEDDEEEVNDE